MKKSMKLMQVVVFGVIAMLVLAGCGGAVTPTAAPAAPTKAAVAPTPAPATAAPTKAAVAPTSAPTTAATAAAAVEVARPSNPGDGGPALQLKGDAAAGKQIFVDNCQKCHGENGVGGVKNPGSDDGTIPSLNPIDDTLVNTDLKVFAYNIDLFVEHGSTPAGPNPQQKMTAWGDDKKLTPQQIADVIAYVISLNTK